LKRLSEEIDTGSEKLHQVGAEIQDGNTGTEQIREQL
jgi:hypothetical protein